MKQLFLSVSFLFTVCIFCSAQNEQTAAVSYDGFYISKTGSVAAAKLDIYTYFRFYKDGTVYLQAVNSYDPAAVSAWFGRYKKFSQKGSYSVNGSAVSIKISNKKSDDFRLEGLEETSFKGTIQSGNQLCLTRDAETEENCFTFVHVNDTTKLKYAQYKPQIKLPGEWKVKQVLKSNGQVFFINDDSTVVAISVFIAAKLPVYKETQTNFESAYAYYEWDSNYFRDELKMNVRKLNDNKEKAFVIWNAKDDHNDNYHLFGRHKKLLYNIMIFDRQMPVEQQLKFIELIYDINRE